jgi:hypothetical protein
MRRIAWTFVPIFVVLCVVFLRAPQEVLAQSSALPVGSIAVSNVLFPCANAINGGSFLPGMTCRTAVISCSNTVSDLVSALAHFIERQGLKSDVATIPDV